MATNHGVGGSTPSKLVYNLKYFEFSNKRVAKFLIDINSKNILFYLKQRFKNLSRASRTKLRFVRTMHQRDTEDEAFTMFEKKNSR